MSKSLRSTKWEKDVDAVTRQTAMEIRAAFEKMACNLPEGAAPQMAVELVVRKLASMTETHLIELLMQLIVEYYDTREAYYAAVPRPFPREKE